MFAMIAAGAAAYHKRPLSMVKGKNKKKEEKGWWGKDIEQKRHTVKNRGRVSVYLYLS